MKLKTSVIKTLVLLMLVSTQIHIAMAQISPFDFGLREAVSDTDRYWALYHAHEEALARNIPVSYEGIDTLEIALPSDFKSIPLSPQTDFGGLVLYVTNNARHGALFTMPNRQNELSLTKHRVETGDFRMIPELSTGDKLLILKDMNPWTVRIGYNSNIFRQDVIWVHNGKGMNSPIAPWNTDSTSLSASYFEVDTSLKVFKGLTMHRREGSTFRTGCLYVKGQFNVLVEDVHVTTPKSKMMADGVFSMSNSARITFRDVTVDGTYSGYGRWRGYGYAFALNNLWDTRFEHVTADGNWGVFGTNYLSNTTLIDCDINRFDIHCYGRDALLK